MSLTLTFDLMCDACGHYISVMSLEEFPGRYLAKRLAEAKYYGIQTGWLVSRSSVLCPRCHESLENYLRSQDVYR